MVSKGMDPALLIAVREEIKVTVNGKIDKLDKKIDEHNAKHEADMKRVMPIIEAFELSERRLADAKEGGRAVIYVAGFITAIGGAWLVLKNIWPGI